MEFLPHEKRLKIVVEGAWLDVDDGIELGRGALFFNAWENLSIRKFDITPKKWLDIDVLNAEELIDLCEVEFFDIETYLRGFSKQSGQWLEWKIVGAKMHAEFE
jgi:hypothetical protein